MTNRSHITSSLRTLATERAGMDALIHAMENELGEAMEQACEIIRKIGGRVIVAGVGKSGHVGSKLAATLASTGTPAFFVHPAEANHGDLGMIARDDCVIALSWSGETAELKGIIAYARRFSIPVVAITRKSESALGREATVCLTLPSVEEACPNGLAPTTSTLMQMALGDCLAVALLEAKGFSADDFGVYHPGGALGANLSRVSEIMHMGDAIPLVPQGTRMEQALTVLSDKRFGCVGVTDDSGALTGIFTDGDLARNLNHDLTTISVDQIMTHAPKTISADAMIAKALSMMDQFNISALIVTDNASMPVGIVHLHDCLRIGAA